MDPRTFFQHGVTSFSLGCYLGTDYTPAEKVNANRQAVKLLEYCSVVPDSGAVRNNQTVINCPSCNLPCGIMYYPNDILGWRFKCPYDHRFKPTTNTLLANAKINTIGLDKVVKIIFKWLRGDKIMDTVEETQVPKITVIRWYRHCRDVAAKIAWHDFIPVGGPGDIIEIDESQLFKRKSNQGRLAAQRAWWAFGGISRVTRKRFAFITQYRDENTLLPYLQQCVNPGSFICSDFWRAYNKVSTVFTGHGRVNHSTNFIHPPRHQPPIWFAPRTFLPECLDASNQFLPPFPNLQPIRYHIQTAERSWRSLKMKLRRCNYPRHAEMYIGEYMYRRNILDNYQTLTEKFRHFLQHCRRAYPGIGLKPMLRDVVNCDCHECL